jgi:hypothetical protein
MQLLELKPWHLATRHGCPTGGLATAGFADKSLPDIFYYLLVSRLTSNLLYMEAKILFLN